MGAAKRRGNFEERKKAAVELHTRLQIERRKAADAREAAMSEEDRKRRHRGRMLLATIAGLGAGIVAGR